MAAALGVGVPPGAGGGGGAALAAHLSDQTEEVGVAFLQADEVKKACEEFALKMKESTMASNQHGFRWEFEIQRSITQFHRLTRRRGRRQFEKGGIVVRG